MILHKYKSLVFRVYISNLKVQTVDQIIEHDIHTEYLWRLNYIYIYIYILFFYFLDDYKVCWSTISAQSSTKYFSPISKIVFFKKIYKIWSPNIFQYEVIFNGLDLSFWISNSRYGHVSWEILYFTKHHSLTIWNLIIKGISIWRSCLMA
jgi:hypothetical protein